ncbi:MAG: O-antigen ligase family protein [Bacteroidota bacterium]
MDVGMKASFIVFPLFFIFFQPQVNWGITVYLFLLGIFLSIVINLVFSFDQYFATNIHHYFFGERFSHFMHRGYWSIYLTIAYVLIWANIIETNKGNLLKYIGLLIVLGSLIMTASKIGLLLLLLSTLYYLYKLSKLIKRKIYLVGIILVLLGGMFATHRLYPQLGSRFTRSVDNIFVPIEEMDKENVESTTARILMWDTSIDLIKDNFWIGVGSGDVKEELQRLNYKKGYTGVAEKNLNSHNQFLNSHVAIGFLGTFCLFLVYIFALSINTYSYQSAVNLIVIVLFIAALPESFLETQAGIVPSAFILTLFGYRKTLIELSIYRVLPK